MRKSIFLCLLLVSAALSFARVCGTANYFTNKFTQDHKKLYASLQSLRFQSTTNCDPEDLFDSVLSKKTEHFQVFYTLDGPHATTSQFADSVAANLERAYNFHSKKLNMRTPIGRNTVTYHYQQKIDKGLFPVEIIDIDLLREGKDVFSAPTCGGCYGITLPYGDEDDGIAEMYIDNDFKYITSASPQKTVTKNGTQCFYMESSTHSKNQITQEDFSVAWDKAIRITVFHELYHAFQLRYMNSSHYTFWFEASATGVEEFGDSTVNDYIGYINTTARYISSNMGTPINEWCNQISCTMGIYGMCSLYLYLSNNVALDFDHNIWEAFAKDPYETVDVHLENYLKKKQLDPDSIFHDYTVRFSFSGNRSSSVSPKTLIHSDENLWQEIGFSKDPEFTPDTSRFSFSYNLNGHPNIENYNGKVSAIIFNDGKAKVAAVKTTNAADSIYSKKNEADSIVWVFSRLGESNFIKTEYTDSTLKAYPTPWREGSLCFSPLPRDKKFVEIRNRRGAIVKHKPYEGTMLCIEEEEVKSMAPGVYWFRAGNSGKTKKLMIIH